MLKKISLAIFIISVISWNSFAETTRTMTDQRVLVDWDFKPEVATYAGYNIDGFAFGMLGEAKLSLTSTIHEKSNEEFTGQGSFYGKIVVKDLDIKIYIDDGESNYNTTTAGTPNPLYIKWDDIEGWIYLGPVYLRLGNTTHDEVRVVSFEDDNELIFGNISYSVLPSYYTASYLGRSNLDDTGLSGALDTSASAETREELVNNNFVESGRNELSVGIQIPNTMKLELGFSTEYTYKEEQFGEYNPFDISLLLEVFALQNFEIKLHSNASSGRNYQSIDDQVGFLGEGNPITTGMLFGYTFKNGNIGITPKFGGEIQLEHKRRVGPYAVSDLGFLSSARDLGNNPEELVYPYELALGVSLDWFSLGYNGKEDASDDFISFVNRDIRVSDGVTIAGIYGQASFDGVQTLYSPYIGGRITYWESEAAGKPGLVPGLHVAFIGNVNYAIGGELDVKDYANAGASDTISQYSNYNIVLKPRMDLGLATDISYTINFFKPYVGGIFKWLDVFNTGTVEYNRSLVNPVTNVSSDTSLTFDQQYNNQLDLRIKVGIEFVRLVANTTFIAEWVTGDLFNELGNVKKAYNDYDYFKNNVSATDNSPLQIDPRAKWGYSRIGVKIKF